MAEVNKRPIVIRDLIDQATYIAEDNLDAAERFLVAAEETFQLLGRMPGMGKLCRFSNPQLLGIRQYPIKGFKNYLIFYRGTDSEVEVLRVLHGAQNLEAILDENLTEDGEGELP
jgi:toxin ParE1/3/4